MNRRPWVKLPARWIEDGGLKQFQWGKQGGSTQTAALMVLMTIAHHGSLHEGLAQLTYDQLTWATHLSRTKVADGLDVLEQRNLVLRAPAGRSSYQLVDYEAKRGWAMIPAQKLYSADGIRAFADFHLRKRSELDALKAYLAFAARRDRKFNRAHITYEQLSDYAGIPEARIKTALSLLIHAELIVVDQKEREPGEFGMSHAYRLRYLLSGTHQGTTGRAEAAPLST